MRAFVAFFESLSQWRQEASRLGIPSIMSQQEYDVLLKGVDADVYVPLWASAAMGEGKPLMDETTWEVVKFYKRFGYTPIPMDANPPDYLGQQLRFLEYLFSCGEMNAAEEFIDRFTAQTVVAFSKGIDSYECPQEVRQLRDCLVQFLNEPHTFAKSEELHAPLPTEAPHCIASAGVGNCGGKCRIDIMVAEGCALQISTDHSDNDPQLRACVRGRAYRHTYLSPHRLRYPMKRIGKRGEGKFQRISWQQAAKEIADAAKRIGQTYGPASRYFLYATGNCGVMRADHMLRRLMNLDGGYLDSYNSYSSACSTFVSPYIYGDANGGHTERDMLNSRLLILWGHNPAETIFGSLRNFYLAQAKKKGIPILVIDPRQSDTALALADQWIGLRPTTDGALADALAYVIVTRGLQDKAFLREFCLGFDEETLPPSAPKGSSYCSYLLGYSDGVPKTPQWGEKITGVPAAVIEELAVKMATTKPMAILPGLGPQRHGNGEQTTRAIAALACLTGNVGICGGSSGLPSAPPKRPQPKFPRGKDRFPGQIPTFLWTKALAHGTELTPRKDGLRGVDHLDSGIKMIFNLAGNTLINQHADINATKKLLQDESLCEMIVVSDLFMTPSAKFADILLPAASFLECNNMAAPWFADDCLLSNAKAVESLFEAMDDYAWVSMVAKQMGLFEPFSEGRVTQEQWLRHLYAEHAKVEPMLPDYASFRANGGILYQDAPLRIAYREQIENHIPFATPSGKIELYSERIAALHDPELPAIARFVPSVEGPDDTLREKYPLQLIGYHTKRRCHSIHDNNDWLEELDPPALWIHPKDAEIRGIRNGNLVLVWNDRGKVRLPAKVTERIVPGVTALSQGGWYTPDATGTDVRGSINVLTRADRPTPLAKGNPQHTNLVQVQLA